MATSASRGKGRPRQVTYRDRPKTGKGHVARAAEPLDAFVSELVIGWVEKHGRDALNPPAPDTSLLAAQLQAAEASLEVLQQAADDGAITDEQWLRRTRPLNQRARGLRERIAAAGAAAVPVSIFTTGDIRAGWEDADIDAKRAIVRAMMTVTVLPVPPGSHGCPPGWKRGDGPYFRPELVRIGWKRRGG